MSTAGAWPDHLLSLAEWDELPADESRRFELIEGVLFVVPKPAPRHQLSMLLLGTELNRQLSPEFCAVPDVEVVLQAGELASVRAPDLVIVPTDRVADSPARFDHSDVLVAIEIVSPGSGRTDRVTKMAEYAEAGIAHYWIIELGPPVTLSTFVQETAGAPYVAGLSGAGVVNLSMPYELRLDLDALTRR